MSQTTNRFLRVDRTALAAMLLGLLCTPLVALVVSEQPRAVILVAFACTGVAIQFIWPMLGIALIIAGVMFSEIFVSAGFALLSLGDLALFAFLAAWLARSIVNPRGVRIPRQIGLMVMYALICLASMQLGVNPQLGHGAYARLACYILGLVALQDVVRTREQLAVVLWVLAISGTAQVLIALNMTSVGGRLSGLSEQPNMLGTRAAIGTLATIGLIPLMPKEAKVRRLILMSMALVTALGVVLTISRGTYIALAIALMWWARRHRGALIAGAFAAALLPMVLDASKASDISTRLEMRDSSVTNRWTVVLNGLKAIEHNPLLGVGFGQFNTLDQHVDVTAEKGRGAHNFYIGLATIIGLPGLFILLSFGGLHFRRISRGRRRFAHFGDTEGNALMTAFQGLAIYQILELTTRGGEPLFQILYLGIYVAAGSLKAEAPPDTAGVPSDTDDVPQDDVVDDAPAEALT